MVLLSSLVRRYQQTSTASGRDGRAPFIEIELDLLGRDVRYNPPLGFCGDGGGLSDRVLTWVDAFLSVGALFARIDGQEGDYIRDLQVCSVQHCAVAVWWSLWQCCSPSVPRLCLQDVVSAMFPPLVDTVQLLKKHGHSMNVRTRAPRALQRRHGLHL